MLRATAQDAIRCSACASSRRVTVMKILAYYQSTGSFKTIWRLCWQHAAELKVQLDAYKAGRP